MGILLAPKKEGNKEMAGKQQKQGRKFAILILTHGRAEKQLTLLSLKNHGYTGKVYFVIDDEDDQADRYRELFGENVIQFPKSTMVIDSMDQVPDKRCITYRRNVTFRIAKDLGLTHFAMMDDDFAFFQYRYQEGPHLPEDPIRSLDEVFDRFCDFLDSTNAVTICMAQAGDFIGGISTTVWKEQLARKAMNTFCCRVDRPIEFKGRLNEDVVTYTTLGSRGVQMFTFAQCMVGQKESQTIEGGISEVYKREGTYTKTFYAVMAMPSAVKVRQIDAGGGARIHHHVKWENTVPKILNQRWKK